MRAPISATLVSIASIASLPVLAVGKVVIVVLIQLDDGDHKSGSWRFEWDDSLFSRFESIDLLPSPFSVVFSSHMGSRLLPSILVLAVNELVLM